jgi:serine/threonine-protein kinase ATR
MMALISRGTTAKPRLNGQASGGSAAFEAPPSTMAVQLISDLSTINEPSRPVEQDDLKRLMREVSNLETSAVQSDDIAVKLEHKHKLIYVFARAVLERLSIDDPFINHEHLILQASDALDVFISAINELPGVLDYVLPAEATLHSRGQEPLWTWLFPRVLTLLGRRQCENLTEKIKDLFYISFQAVARSPLHWNLNSFFFTYLKECITSKHTVLPLNFSLQLTLIQLPWTMCKTPASFLIPTYWTLHCRLMTSAGLCHLSKALTNL